MVKPTALLFLSSLFLLLSCSGHPGFEDIRTLQEAQQQWETSGIDDYGVDVERLCFCPPPLRFKIVVENGIITKAVDLESGDTLGGNFQANTIDEHFEWLRKAIDREPETLEMQFDPAYGFPAFINYDQSSHIADEEFTLKLSNFEVQ